MFALIAPRATCRGPRKLNSSNLSYVLDHALSRVMSSKIGKASTAPQARV